MDWRHVLLGSLTFAALAGSADAGYIFNRNKSKESAKEAPKPPTVEDQVGELIKALRGSADERRRGAAADELAKADLRQYPQAGEALMTALQQDPSAAVRIEVAQAIGRLRPLTLQGGQALEEAMNGDSSPRVRTVARSAIAIYVQAGYRLGTQESRPVAQTPPAPRPTVTRPTPVTPQRPVSRQTGEPPLAASKPSVDVETPATRPVLLPRQAQSPPIELKPAPSSPRLLGPVKESQPDVTKPTKPAKSDEDGPILIGPG
jgi:hypothetical protein